MKKTLWASGSVLVCALVGTSVFCYFLLQRMDRMVEATKVIQASSEEMALQVEITNSLISSDTVRLRVIEYLKHHSTKLSPSQCVAAGGAIMEGVSIYHIPASLTLAIIEKESTFDPDATSPQGALGLMQILPATALPYLREISPRPVSVTEALRCPETNVRIGLAYLNDLHTSLMDGSTFTYSLVAYNSGELSARALRNHTSVPPVSLSYASSILHLQQQIRPQGELP